MLESFEFEEIKGQSKEASKMGTMNIRSVQRDFEPFLELQRGCDDLTFLNKKCLQAIRDCIKIFF